MSGTNQARDELRAKLLSNVGASRKRLPFTLMGQEIEIVQPTIGDIDQLSAKRGEKGTTSFVDILIDFAYVPGTDTRVFEAADRAVLTGIPFNEEMQKLVDNLTTLFGGEIKEQAKK